MGTPVYFYNLLKSVTNTIIIATVTATHGPRELAEEIEIRRQAVLGFQTEAPVIGIIAFQGQAERPVPEEVQAGTEVAVDQSGPRVEQTAAAAVLQVEVRTDLSLKDVFVSSEARYKLWMKDRFVVFSPEIFVKIRDEHIYSYPMKGTIDATLPDARRRILEDPKETAEHATIVDLIRNDLSMVATEVMVTRYRYIELPTHQGALLQVSSEIRGRLAGGWQAEVGDLFFRLLPAGSITGAPKKKTMEIIAEAETYERGFYTGVMGYFDGNSLDSAVMIRFLEQQADGSLIFKSGGGITSQSDLTSEYNEMKQKVYVPIY